MNNCAKKCLRRRNCLISQFLAQAFGSFGDLSHLLTTKKELGRAANDPVGVIIVGVGNAAVDAMEELDSPTEVRSYGSAGYRPICDVSAVCSRSCPIASATLAGGTSGMRLLKELVPFACMCGPLEGNQEPSMNGERRRVTDLCVNGMWEV
jgi:hypothetical protein